MGRTYLFYLYPRLSFNCARTWNVTLACIITFAVDMALSY